MNTGPIRLLLIEDNPADARLLQEMLADARSSEFEIGWINQLHAALDRLTMGRIDVVLLDLTLPDSEGLETFTRVNAAAPEIPIVVLTGRKDEELAIKALAEGAQDYLVKGTIDTELLARALRYAIERKQAEAAQRERSEHLERLNKALHLQRKKLLEQTDHLTRANEELKRLSNAKSEFVTAVSHDLRTPLTTIVEGISLTEDGTLGPINDEQRKYLHFALEEAERLTTLLNEILDISRIEAGRVVASRVKLDVRSQILRITHSYEAYARDKTLSMKVNVPEDIPPVLCDPEHYDRILTNLLSNAVKFNRPGGWIAVSASRGPQESVVTTVADSGVGIPKTERSRIFGRFERVARPGTYRETGSGLGLALSRQLVELNDGSISFDSEENQGSVFHFALPVYAELRELTWALKAVNVQARATAGVTAVFLCQVAADGQRLAAYRPNSGPSAVGRDAPGEGEATPQAISLDWGLTLDRVAEVIRGEVKVEDKIESSTFTFASAFPGGVLRVLTERAAVILICALPAERVLGRFDNLVDTIRKAELKDVAAAFQICPDPLPDVGSLLDALSGRMSPIE